MIERLDWSDVRVFLATMRASSLRQAAAQLGISHPTARRRLDAFEEQTGLKLFDRRPDGLHATPEAVALLEQAEEVERAMSALGRAVQAVDPELRGSIHLTLPDVIATDLLMPDLVAFAQHWPQIELHIEASYDLADLARREADVAIRFMPHGLAPDEELAGRLADTAYNAVYGVGDSWIGWRGPQDDRAWVDRTAFSELPIRGTMDNIYLQREACAAGLGLTMMPCFFAEPRLSRRTEPVPGRDIWVLVHPDLRRNPRLRVFRDAMVDAVRSKRARLLGARSP